MIVLSNPVYSHIPDIHHLLEARYRGAKVIAVAPDKNASSQFADLWVPIDWSADPALWLGVCKILLDNGWVDTEFMKEQTDLPILVRWTTSAICARRTSRRRATQSSSTQWIRPMGL